MPYEIVNPASYRKKAIAFFKKHPDLLPRYEKTITLLTIDPHHPSLRLHKLKGKLAEYHSVSISMQYRIVVYFVIREKQIVLIDIGKHEDVY